MEGDGTSSYESDKSESSSESSDQSEWGESACSSTAAYDTDVASDDGGDDDDEDDEFVLSPGGPQGRDYEELHENRPIDRTEAELATFAHALRERQKAEVDRISRLPFATRGDLVLVARLSRFLYGEDPVHDPSQPIDHARNVFRPLEAFFPSFDCWTLDPGATTKLIAFIAFSHQNAVVSVIQLRRLTMKSSV